MAKHNGGRRTASISCIVDEGFMRRLRVQAAEENVPIALIVREAIDKELKRRVKSNKAAIFFGDGGASTSPTGS